MNKYVFFIGMFISFLLSACSNEKGDIEITHFAYQETENGKWGIMSIEGKIVVAPTFQSMPTPVTEGCFWVSKPDGTYELHNINTPKEIVDDRYTDIMAFNEGKALVTKIGEKNIICIDKKGNKLFELPEGIKAARCFHDGMAAVVEQNGDIGYIDQNGTIVIPCQYQLAHSFKNDYAIVVSVNRKFIETFADENLGANCSIINKDGKHITDITADNSLETLNIMFESLENNLWRAGTIGTDYITPYIEKGGHGLKTLKDNIIVPADTKYKIISSPLGDYCIFQTENGYGIMDKKGQIVVQDKYDRISMIRKNELFIACKNAKWGILSMDEKQICPFNFDFVSSTSGQYFIGINKEGDNLIYKLITKSGEIKKTFWKMSWNLDQGVEKR